MNYENLHEIISRYEQNLDYLNDSVRDEKFKWHAVQRFQDAWFAVDAETLPFAELFHRALKGSSILVNNRTVQPANGVVKLAEKEPEEVEHLFRRVLYADDHNDLNLRQKHMEEFLDGMEKLRLQYYPRSWKYQQNRNAVSCYLSMFAPESNYIYKYSPVEAFARYTEYGKDIGSGGTFSLANYYELGDIIVAALAEHPELLKKHAKILDATYYQDNSQHLLAFDVIYCAFTYGFFKDLKHKSKKEALKSYAVEQKRNAEEEERQAQIDALEERIERIESQLDVYRAISLLGTQVYHKVLGTGIIFEQNVNKIKVRFGDIEKAYIINSKYPMRPTFEDDAEIVEALTDYELKLQERENLRKQLSRLL